MLKKKLPTAATTKQQAAPPVKQSKRPVEDDDYDPEDDESTDTDEGEEEQEEVTPKSTKRSATAEKLPARTTVVGGSKKSSLAAAFDSVPASNNADNIPAGKYEAIVKGAVLQDPDPKGQSIRLSFELCNSDFGDNNQITTWFKMIDANGEKSVGGIRAFKGTMARLGYDIESFDQLEEIFEEIANDRPGVLLKISYAKDQNGNIWQRAMVDAQCDNERVQEYKDTVAY